MMDSDYKHIPSVSEILDRIRGAEYIHRKYLTALIREELAKYRKLAKKSALDMSRSEIIDKIIDDVTAVLKGNFKKVINGTGIVLHTGFGRAPVSSDLLGELANILDGYTNLEFDLNSGKRGDRNTHINQRLSAISGTESALVVNNNAAAVMLAINTLSRGREVIVSRGQLVEIGGSFRIPDMIDRSSAVLKEVGSTNRTHLKDYENALNNETGLILWVHTSNYKVDGFTNEVPLTDLVSLSKRKKIPVMADLGSGVMVRSGFEPETEQTVEEVSRSGVDVLTYSGDKLLGGPQSGIIAGKKRYLDRLKKNSMYRALRCDKFTIALLERTLMTYTDGKVLNRNLTHFLLNRTRLELVKLGNYIIESVGAVNCDKLGLKLIESLVEAGSGSLPVESIESMALIFNIPKPGPSKISMLFRTGQNPVVGYIKNNRFYIDLKAIIPGEEEALIDGIVETVKRI